MTESAAERRSSIYEDGPLPRGWHILVRAHDHVWNNKKGFPLDIRWITCKELVGLIAKVDFPQEVQP